MQLDQKLKEVYQYIIFESGKDIQYLKEIESTQDITRLNELSKITESNRLKEYIALKILSIQLQA